MWHPPLEAEALPVAGTSLAKSLVAHMKSKSDGIYHEMLLEDHWNTKSCHGYALRGASSARVPCPGNVLWPSDASLVRQESVTRYLPHPLQSLVPQTMHAAVDCHAPPH